jgi:amino acid transporter
MGYAQELRRHMSGFSNFAVSFTIISILSGCLTLYGTGMKTGGPALITWGWPFVGVMTLLVGLSMAEVCSSYPTAGGLYYWSAKLAKRNAPAWSWYTGWFNFLGQVAVTAGIDFGAAFFLNALLDLQWGFDTRPWHTIVLFAAILVLHALLNQFGVGIVAKLNDISVWWHIVGVLLIVGVLAFVPSHHQSASYVFGHFVNDTGWGSTFYVALLGLLLAQYTFTGYDASAHMTEETRDASTAGPRGIITSILVSLAAGWVLLIGITFAIQHYNGELGAAGALILGLPYLWNSTAYVAVTSIAVIGLYVAYVLPTLLRLLRGVDFVPGPWHLGRWSRPIGIIAVAWVAFISILFMLPTAAPVTVSTFNYTVVAVVAVLGFATIYWFVSARRWFKGPKVQGSAEELAAIEHELESLA